MATEATEAVYPPRTTAQILGAVSQPVCNSAPINNVNQQVVYCTSVNCSEAQKTKHIDLMLTNDSLVRRAGISICVICQQPMRVSHYE